eukprot:1173976-Prorocentrum_minimum.AAC.1
MMLFEETESDCAAQEGCADKHTVKCQTVKSDWQKNKQRGAMYRTAGLLGMVSPCGVVRSVRELYGTESCSQVVCHLLQFCETTGRFPQLLGYDDGCHLHGFIHLPARAAQWATNASWQKLQQMRIFID